MLKVTTNRIIGIGLATCLVASGSIYMRKKLEDKIANQKLCKDCIQKVLQNKTSIESLGEPIEWKRPNLSNAYNYISSTKATIALPVLGSKKSGELLIEASKEKTDETWTLDSLKLKIPDEEILIN
ncbi:uncharacterized protein CEXT_298731 [Caerostris extrusa]|uniref:Uncharacterized protein n=1 Tax=Caerostris extrusa TaxID=172846 RepID=A0AAV4QVI2_CAEEX|nr:uncharacterized protein CEXT_298731 [Caerostris extrusa]